MLFGIGNPNALGLNKGSPDDAGQYDETVSTSVSSHTKGSWTDIDSDDFYEAGAEGLLIELGNSTGTPRRYLVDIGYRAGASEIALLENLGYWAISTSHPVFAYLPLKIPAGAYKLIVRAQSDLGNSSFRFNASRVPPHLDGLPSFQQVETLGADLVNTRGADIVAALSSAHNWGSWVSMGTLAGQCRWILLSLGYNEGYFSGGIQRHFQIGIGAPGSQIVLLNNIYVNSGQNLSVWTEPMPAMWSLPLNIAAGTQVWMRQRMNRSISDADVAGFMATLHCFR